MGEIRKLGPKGRHFEIPEGWKRVTIGSVRRGDKWVSPWNLELNDCDDEDLGASYTLFDLLIRPDPKQENSF